MCFVSSDITGTTRNFRAEFSPAHIKIAVESVTVEQKEMLMPKTALININEVLLF